MYSTGEKTIYLNNSAFAPHVKQGLILYKKHMSDIDNIVKENKQISFKANGSEELVEIIKGKLPDNFYETMEGRVEELQKRGIDNQDINVVLSNEINRYFKKLASNVRENINKEEISKLVSPEIIEMVEDFLNNSVKELDRILPAKTFYGLCLHIDSTIKD